MNEKYHCKNCSYFFGKEGIHCAVHPYGKEQEHCSDWQVQNLSLQEGKSMNTDMETKSYTKFASHLVAIGVTFLIGYPLHQDIFPAIRANENYNACETKCQISLERASNAGTTGTASIELLKAVNLLKSNSSTQSFEYRNLAANLDYLEEQPKNTLMPKIIQDSISNNLKDIQENQLKLQYEDSSGVGIFIVLVMFSYVLILIYLLVLIVAEALEKIFDL